MSEADVSSYVLERRFNAPRDLVWRAWTEPDLLAHWYGPNVETVIHQFELKPGGLWLGEMRMERGVMYQRAEFLEVTPTSRLVWVQGGSDADWNLAKSPQMPDWPLQMLTDVAFKSVGDETEIRLTWTPHEASDAEVAAFAAAMSQMGGGWEMGMAVLDTLLEELKQKGG